jgi:hypothetical protein
MAIESTALRALTERVKARLEAILHPITNVTFINVFEQGDTVNRTLPVIAEVIYGEEDAQERESTRILTHDLPFTVELFFEASDFDGATVKAIHHDLLKRLKMAFMADETARTLDGTARVVDYIGAGSALAPYDEEKSPGVWRFLTRWRATYRHDIHNPSQQL